MNLFVDEFIVALDGDLADVPAVDLARESGLPAGELSTNPWLCYPTIEAGRH